MKRVHTAIVLAVLFALELCGRSPPQKKDSPPPVPIMSDIQAVDFEATPPFSEFRYVVRVSRNSVGADVAIDSFPYRPRASSFRDTARVPLATFERIASAAVDLRIHPIHREDCTDAVMFKLTLRSNTATSVTKLDDCQVESSAFSKTFYQSLAAIVRPEARPNYSSWVRLP